MLPFVFCTRFCNSLHLIHFVDTSCHSRFIHVLTVCIGSFKVVTGVTVCAVVMTLCKPSEFKFLQWVDLDSNHNFRITAGIIG